MQKPEPSFLDHCKNFLREYGKTYVRYIDLREAFEKGKVSKMAFIEPTPLPYCPDPNSGPIDNIMLLTLNRGTLKFLGIENRFQLRVAKVKSDPALAEILSRTYVDGIRPPTLPQSPQPSEAQSPDLNL